MLPRLVPALLALAVPLAAQPTIPPASKNILLPQGAPVPVKLAHGVSARSARAGDRVILRVARDVEFKGAVVIPVDSLVEAEVDQVTAPGGSGRAGSVRIVANAVILEAGGRIPLDGVLTKEGADNTPSAGQGAITVPLGRAGQNINLEAGTVFLARTAKDF